MSVQEVSPQEKFFFDLNGYIVVRNVLSPEEVTAANAEIDMHTGDFQERVGKLRNTVENTPMSGDGKTGRFDLGGFLGWKKPQGDVFRSILAHPKLVPYLHAFIGKGYRLDHQPLIIGQKKGSEGFALHGGPLDRDGNLYPSLQYRYVNGSFYNTLLAVSVQFCDHNEGDGGFCIVPGSHKINVKVPDQMIHGQLYRECIQQPQTKAGDVVIFSEATVHGCLPWTRDHERRIALYRFSPCHLAYGRSYLPHWPEEVLENATPEQRIALLPPFAMRLDRPSLTDEGQIDESAGERAEFKKDFDKAVFGSKYF
uniref:Phytanoyl-CoA dioxygenase family protein n=1 Tax=Chromera velia CCMP2878 TaxID=1169474 RepID=A0A0G4HD63_9ALVE|eukprot:Cvel_6414.t1-p1 / transcript=Cvel_6414.t1 / gene=Cvel_6414 / organism=Chromera_velia_CCMP2878 / gene_product=hypothetical protein / transcript_product=hypothetical protein / location=Cvel_scaffold313:81155-82084(-) / protein_length=310 / sequence_SO=supercontig / SO=protein_coding / is_pseudo=false